ncbi:hypothetical protein INT43_004816 [Umbelopsis isabellina]|uniref:Peptide hydrolase n=1 Tax=Mortierella isabellina TaxID=91625 RepID=A0A8H7PE64_MORIS|nr:hypothetical protein INT43_004816 [Umbelopsis isabellina]
MPATKTRVALGFGIKHRSREFREGRKELQVTSSGDQADFEKLNRIRSQQSIPLSKSAACQQRGRHYCLQFRTILVSGHVSTDLSTASAKSWRKALEWGLLCGIALLLLILSLVFAEETFGGHPSKSMVVKALNTEDIIEHLKALMEVAGQHHNSRSIRNGYNASAEYIKHQLENGANCDVTTQVFPVQIWEEIQDAEFVVLEASGDMTAFKERKDFICMDIQMLQTAATSTLLFDNKLIELDDLCGDQGCSQKVEGKLVIAPFSEHMQKNVVIAQHLAEAKAAAIMFINIQSPSASFTQLASYNQYLESNVTLPIFAISNDLYNYLLNMMRDDYLVNIQTHVAISKSYTYNIFCEWRGGDENNKVIVGSYLDSVEKSPGINAGSGAATSLAIALALGSLSYQPTNKLVFAWWGAKEAQNTGISHYLQSQSDEFKSNIAANIHLDMLGSQNYIPYILRTNPTSEHVAEHSNKIAEAFEHYFDSIGYSYTHTYSTDGTPHDIFATQADIAYGGLYSGMAPKTPAQKRKFGGIAYVEADPCYHMACDTVDNISVDGIHLASD